LAIAKNLAILLDCPGQIGIMNIRWVRDILSLLSPSAPWPTFDKIPDEPQQRVRCRQVSHHSPTARPHGFTDPKTLGPDNLPFGGKN